MSRDNQSLSYFRTEDILPEYILDYYVPSEGDQAIISQLMGSAPILLVGSRGMGKTILLRVAEATLQQNIKENKVFPVFVSFNQSSYVDPKLFRPWMIAKILFQIKLKLVKLGYVSTAKDLFTRYTGMNINDDLFADRMEKFTRLLEESWRSGSGFIVNEDRVKEVLGVNIYDFTPLNEMDVFKALINDLCEEFGFKRINVFFDEAAHNFYPSQQREFFGMFRDLRSARFCGVAAVYPGLTSYGHTFQTFHDATRIVLGHPINSDDYLQRMEGIVRERVDDSTWTKLREQGEALHALIYSASGNPRLLFKSLLATTDNLQKRIQTNRVNEIIRSFYRSDIWNEHTRLSEIYKGHRSLIDWGRNFVENSVLLETKKRNDVREAKGQDIRTLYFVVHRDAPEAVKSAIRILEYTGIVNLIDEGVKMARSELGTRYVINFGCVLAQEQNPISKAMEIRRGLKLDKFTDYGFKHSAFDDIELSLTLESETSIESALDAILEKPIQELDLTVFQLSKLINELSIHKIGEVLRLTEEDLQKVPQIGVKRSRHIMSLAINAALEYISG